MTASLIALCGDAHIATAASGSCSGPGEDVCGGSRPLNPSGDDWRDAFVGLVVEEGMLALVLGADAVVTVEETDVMTCCLGGERADGEEEREAFKKPPMGGGGDEVAVDVMFQEHCW